MNSSMSGEVQGWFDKIKKSSEKKKVALKTDVVNLHSAITSIAGSIAEYAESEGVDLIVIGTRGSFFTSIAFMI
jgi:nucleotide-binding universal stress UspA family protein